MGYNRCPLFIILTEQRFCVVSFIKINKNWISETDIVEAWSIWNFVFMAIPLEPETTIKTLSS
jgi:hypothetical protein